MIFVIDISQTTEKYSKAICWCDPCLYLLSIYLWWIYLWWCTYLWYIYLWCTSFSVTQYVTTHTQTIKHKQVFWLLPTFRFPLCHNVVTMSESLDPKLTRQVSKSTFLMGKQVCWKNWSQKYPFICFSHVIVAAGPLSAIDGALSSSSSHQVLDITVIGKRIFGSRRMPISCPWWVGEQKIRSFFFSSPYFAL